MSNIGIALDLAAVRVPAARDLAYTLERVRAAGFDFVQWRGLTPLTMVGVQAALDAAGLTAIAGGMTYDALARDPEASIDYWRSLRVPDLSVDGAHASAHESTEAWSHFAAELGELAARFYDAGIRLAYHPAADDFALLSDGVVPWLDHLIDATASHALHFEFDTATLFGACGDAASYIRRCPARCPLVHLREYASGGNEKELALGAGELDWDSVFDSGEEVAAEWYVCSHNAGADPFANLAASYAFLSERA